MEKGAKFYVTDCIGTGAIQRTADAGKASVIRVNYDDTATVGSGIMYLYSGTITGGSGDYINDGSERSYKGGGGVYNAGTFRMFGGNIVNNTSTVNGGGICNDLAELLLTTLLRENQEMVLKMAVVVSLMWDRLICVAMPLYQITQPMAMVVES